MNMVLIAVFFGIAFFVASFYIRSAYHARDYSTMTYGFALAIVAAMFSAFGIANSRPRSRSLTVTTLFDGASANGLHIKVTRWRTYAMWIFIIVGLTFFLTRVAIIVQDLGSERTPDDSTSTGLAITQIAMSLMFAGIFAGLIVYLLNARGRIHLLLTPTGITYQDGRSRKSLKWSDIDHVEATFPNKITTTRLIAARDSAIEVESRGLLARLSRKQYGCLDIPSGFTIDPASLLYSIDFYARHPELRDELGSTASINRIARGDLLS